MGKLSQDSRVISRSGIPPQLFPRHVFRTPSIPCGVANVWVVGAMLLSRSVITTVGTKCLLAANYKTFP